MADGASDAAAAIAELIPEVGGALSSGSGSMALLRWRGNLNYRIDSMHGKVVIEGRNDAGGSIGVTKRSSALVGAEFNVFLTRNEEEIAKIYLTTSYSGGSKAQIVYGDEWFYSDVVTEGSSTALILIYKDNQ